MDKSQKNRLKRTDLSPKQKIDIIKNLSAEAGLETGNVFDEFFRPELRNAISHSDFIFTEEGFRCRGGSGLRAFGITFEDLDGILTKAKVFISIFFGLEREARRRWGEYLGRGMPYDTHYKGILEVLVDDESLLNGFKVHWPNNTESVYRRTPDGVEMTNCLLDLEHANIELFVGSRARRPGEFSPLVEFDSQPEYTPLEGGNGRPTWPEA